MAKQDTDPLRLLWCSIFVYIFLVLGTEPRAPQVLSKSSTTEPNLPAMSLIIVANTL
jgi:hypothetical protein